MKKIVLLAGLVFCFVFTGFASAEYIDNEDGTITDNRTSLMWQKTYAANSDWDTVNSYCTQSGTGGYYDWRMPTLTELQVLVDPAYRPTIDPIFACPSNSYCFFWSSTLESSDPSVAWVVRFYDGAIFLKATSEDSYACVRCVRGAQTPSTTCISIGSDLSITIPCVEYNGVKYILKLKYYYDPTLPPGLYWQMESVQQK